MSAVIKRSGPVKRGTLGNKPKVVIPIATLAAISETTNYTVVIDRYMKKIKSPKTAIRAKCVECSGGSLKEVQECRVTKCALYPFRMGKNPYHGRATANRTEEVEAENDNDNDEDDDVESTQE